MLPSTVQVYPACIRLFADDPSLELSRKLWWKGQLRLGNLHESTCRFFIWQDSGKTLAFRPSECICTCVLASPGEVMVKLQKIAALFSCPGQKVSLFETWECDLVAYIPSLILLESEATCLNSQDRYITNYQRRYLLNILPQLPGSDRQFVCHNSLSLCCQPNQGSFCIYTCEEGGIAILDFAFKAHAQREICSD